MKNFFIVATLFLGSIVMGVQTRAAHVTVTSPSLLEVAQQREQLLETLIELNPQLVIDTALSPQARASMPADVRAHIEEQVDLQGSLDLYHIDFADNTSKYEYILNTNDNRHLKLFFAKDTPQKLLTGAMIRVQGLRVNNALALSSGSTDLQVVVAAPQPNTFGSQKTILFLVNFQNDPTNKPYTLAYAKSIMDTTSNFDMENSFQQTSLAGVVNPSEHADVVGWYTIPQDNTGCDFLLLGNQARAAAQAAGVNLTLYNRFIYSFPRNGCGWTGLGTVGGFPSQAWINNGAFGFTLRILGHELGHNLGLYHSHSLDCGSVVLGGTCARSEYGDIFDIMGTSANHFNAFQKENLGWLNYNASPPIAMITTDGTYTIDAYESMPGANPNPKALKIPRLSGSFYVEFRRAIGFDSSLASNPSIANGVVVHWVTPDGNIYGGIHDGSYLLDMTPGTNSFTDSPLTVGKSYVDPASGVTITLVSVSSTSASVRVSFTRDITPPAVSFVSPFPNTYASTTISMEASATDNVGVARVDFYKDTDANPFASLVNAPYRTTLTASALVQGTHTLMARAYDAAGNVGTASASFTVDRVGPIVSLSAPASGATVSGVAVTLSANATDAIAMGHMDFVLNGTTVVGSDNTSPYAITWDSTSVANASYALTAVAFDKAGNKTISAARTLRTLNVATTTTNHAPIINAGADQTIATSTIAFLSGSASDDGLPNPPKKLTTTWYTAKGPGTVTFENALLLTTTASFSEVGIYTLGLTASDSLLVSDDFMTVTVGAEPPPDATFSDEFNRADSSDLGNGWVETAGNLFIQTNQVRNTSGLTSPQIALQPSMSGKDVNISMNFSFDRLHESRYGFILRYQDASNYYKLYRQSGSGSYLRIGKVVNGVETILASRSLSNPATNALFFMKAAVTSATLTLIAPGSITLTVTDPTFVSGSPGFFIASTGSQKVDSFAATKSSALVEAGSSVKILAAESVKNSSLANLQSALNSILNTLNRFKME